MFRSNRLGCFAILLASVALYLAWKAATRGPVRLRARPGHPFYSEEQAEQIDESDSLSQQYEEPTFGAGPPEFTAQYSDNGTRQFQHDAGW